MPPGCLSGVMSVASRLGIALLSSWLTRSSDQTLQTFLQEPQGFRRCSNSGFWARSQNCGKQLLASSCLMSVRLSFHPHGTTQLPQNRFSLNLVHENFSKIKFKKIQNSLNSGKNNRYFI